jgi:hypothetical protein
MQSWVDKASTSNSLHYDKTLSYLNSQHASSSLSSSSSSSHQKGFRTAAPAPGSRIATEKELDDYNKYSSFASHHFSPLITPPQYESPLDGSDVLSFLNSTEYSDHIHGDDLKPDSMTYISHRHQQDTHQALSEKEKLQQHWTAELLAAEDIVEYLQNADYTQDIYGIPVLGQWIREAKEEILKDDSHKKIAVERLNMIRHHLVQKAMGDPELAARNALQMTQNDWSSSFLDSS